MRSKTSAHAWSHLELQPKPHQRSLDIDFDREEIILVVGVKIAATDKYLGGVLFIFVV
jgi:hypothetical protein